MLMEERVRKKKEKSKLNQITVGKYRSLALEGTFEERQHLERHSPSCP